MINGITYFRLHPPYEGDYLKNCGLEGSEIDNNFYVLESRDVKEVSVVGDDIVLTLYNGDTVSAKDALSGYAKDLSFDFDEEKGVLIITQNGEVTEIPGFSSNCCSIATDNTLIGDGTKENPLGVAMNQGTGHYKPVISLIDLTDENGKLPNPEDLHVGDRYVVKDSINTDGLLYDYKGVKAIACMLKGTEWRIPEKKDWDNMLNAVEPDTSYANHDEMGGYRWLGKYAGKFLKTNSVKTDEEPCGWDMEGCQNGGDDCCDDDCNCGENCDETLNPCVTHDCGHEHVGQTGAQEQPKTGIDCYDFGVKPTGFAYDSRNASFYGKKAFFWTASNCETEVIVKGFDACKNGVLQDIVPKTNFMSLRLVKDYNGRNYYGQENVAGQPFETVLMPSNTIWTATNVALPLCGCHTIKPDASEECENNETTYYIVEWDGTSWHYQSLENCEIVTIENVSEEECCIDYKLVDGELVPNNLQTMSDIAELNERLDNEIEARIGADDTINENISTLQDSLNAANNKIDELTEQVEEFEDKLDEANETIVNLTQIIVGNSEYTSDKSIAERLAFIERLLTDDESGELTTLDFNDWQADGDEENDGWEWDNDNQG